MCGFFCGFLKRLRVTTWPKKIPSVYAKQLRGKGWQRRKKNGEARQGYPGNLWILNRPKVCPE